MEKRAVTGEDLRGLTPKPFVKWVGGKRGVLSQLTPLLPYDLGIGQRFRYFEPFLGGGAMFLHIRHFYPKMRCVGSDLNPMLVMAWNSVISDTEYLIKCLQEIKEEYLSAPFGSKEREDFYYAVREQFNEMKGCSFQRQDEQTEQSALFIFLNFTCFNGLYRENGKGEFNSPHGKYLDNQVRIYDEDNLWALSRVLKGSTIRTQHYTGIWSMVNNQSFIYFDPPYREIVQASNANKSGVFQKINGFTNDEKQLELAAFANDCAGQGAKVMVSNSDPQFKEPSDDFFEKAYPPDTWNIQRVYAKRSVNSDGEGRKPIPELVIRNYTN